MRKINKRSRCWSSKKSSCRTEFKNLIRIFSLRQPTFRPSGPSKKPPRLSTRWRENRGKLNWNSNLLLCKMKFRKLSLRLKALIRMSWNSKDLI